MPSLYELSTQYKQFVELANATLETEEGNEIDTLEMMIDTLDAIQDSIEHKSENIVKFLRNIEGDIASFKAEEQRLAKKRKSLENKFDGLKEYTKQMLEMAGIEKVAAGSFNVRLQKNPPSVSVYNEAKIPELYKIPQPSKIDTKKILEDLKTGEILIDGAELITDKKHLRIS